MITLIFIIGIGLVLLSVWFFQMRLIFAVPIVLSLYYLAFQPVPKIMGFPVHERYIQGEEGIVLGGFTSTLMILFKGDVVPRLVYIVDPKKAEAALNQSKKKPTFVLFDSREEAEQGISGGSNEQTGPKSKLRILNVDAQTMLEKID